jgi:hypothetical protein
VLGAMAASQDGQLDEALRYINFSDIDLLIDDSTSTQDIHPILSRVSEEIEES